MRGPKSRQSKNKPSIQVKFGVYNHDKKNPKEGGL